MKRILIVNNNMHIGGVQKSLLNFLVNLCDVYEITLVLFNPHGALLSEIPQQVKVQSVKSAYRFLGISNQDVCGKPVLKLQRSFWAAVTRMLGRDWAIAAMAQGQKQIGYYDVAISFLHDASDRMFYGGCNDFVLRHVDAKKKIAFLHCDYIGCGAATPKNNARYMRFDMVAACSDGCRKSFLREVPCMAKKTHIVPNFQNYLQIQSLAALAPVELPAERMNILTVARLGKEKSITRAIKAFKDASFTNYHYYIIGDGIERSVIEQMIKFYDLEEYVSLLGEKENPYGYMAAADLMLIPSLSEAAPMVIGEAACLGTPILSTETSSAREMIEKTGFGWVCENSTEGIAKSIADLLSEPSKVAQKRAYLRRITLTNDDAMSQILHII